MQDAQHKEQDPLGMAMAPSPSSNIPTPPSPATPATCPPTVSECDFYFQGSQTTVPGFSISNAKPDGPISPPIVTSVQGTSITVAVMNTAKSEYICNATAVPPDDQFYTSGAVSSQSPCGLYGRVTQKEQAGTGVLDVLRCPGPVQASASA